MVGLDNSRFRKSAVEHNAQLDPLDDRAELTTPAEWAVLACFGLVLAALVVWGIFGGVDRTLRLDNVLIVTESDGRLAAVAFVAPKNAWRLKAGMTARVTVATPEGARRLPAKLTEVSPHPADPPDRLARMGSGATAEGQGHTVRFALSVPPGRVIRPGGAGARIKDGTPSRIEIVLERTSPLALLMRR